MKNFWAILCLAFDLINAEYIDLRDNKQHPAMWVDDLNETGKTLGILRGAKDDLSRFQTVKHYPTDAISIVERVSPVVEKVIHSYLWH